MMRAIPQTPALYRTDVRHTRTAPVRRQFRYPSYTWLVDLADLDAVAAALPRAARGLVRFEARDHIGDPARSIRDNVATFLDGRGVAVGDTDRLLMLAQPRVGPWAFNPISVVWCLTADGQERAVVVEVHNTYGDRHAYLVHPDAAGHAAVDKAMYVSPFHDVSGSYDLDVPLPGESVLVRVRLSGHGATPFVAALRGSRTGVGATSVARVLLRHPVEPLRVMGLIRSQGIRIWLRRLPVQPRA
jgi:DUF1365 family protein